MKRAGFFVPLFALLASLLANAADNQWISHGPYGGYFQSFLFHPEKSEVIFASSFDGLFRSKDTGLTWERLNIPGGEFIARIHPRKPDIILAANFSDGLFRSTDLGNSWEQIFEYPFEVDCFYDMEFHPSDPNILYGVTYYHGVYKSTDAGRNWVPINSKLNLKPVADCCLDIPQLEVDRSNGNIVYILLPSRLIYRTTNGGMTWQSMSAGLNFRKEVRALAIDPKDSNVLYAGGSQGIFRTANGGKKWTSRRCECYIWDFEIDPVHHDTLYAVGEGASKSTNSGGSWEWFSPHPYLSDVLLGIGIHPKRPDLVFVAGFGGGIFRSENGGRSWKTVNDRLDALNILRLEASPDDSRHIFAVGGQQAFESLDGGKTWDLFMKGQLSTFRVSDIIIHPKNPKLIVAAGHRKPLGAVNISPDGGKSWRVHSNYRGVNFGCSACVALDPQDQNVIYLAPFEKKNERNISLGVAKSTDQGKTWNLINDGLDQKDVWIIAVHPEQAQFLFAGTGTGKLYRSMNGGKKWEETSGLDDSSIRSIAFDPKNLDLVYLATYSSIFKSINGGRSWVSKSKTLHASWFNFISLDPASSQTVYATGGGGIFVSRDSGETWTISEWATPGPFAVWNLLISPSDPPLYFAGTDRGVFQLQNIGQRAHK
jgi:photosystem II stability/assembly factor-like uncharacterized protein